MDRAVGFYPIGRGFKSSWGHCLWSDSAVMLALTYKGAKATVVMLHAGNADVAQLAERLPRKEDVVGSSPAFGSSSPICIAGGSLVLLVASYCCATLLQFGRTPPLTKTCHPSRYLHHAQTPLPACLPLTYASPCGAPPTSFSGQTTVHFGTHSKRCF